MVLASRATRTATAVPRTVCVWRRLDSRRRRNQSLVQKCEPLRPFSVRGRRGNTAAAVPDKHVLCGAAITRSTSIFATVCARKRSRRIPPALRAIRRKTIGVEVLVQAPVGHFRHKSRSRHASTVRVSPAPRSRRNPRVHALNDPVKHLGCRRGTTSARCGVSKMRSRRRPGSRLSRCAGRSLRSSIRPPGKDFRSCGSRTRGPVTVPEVQWLAIVVFYRGARDI